MCVYFYDYYYNSLQMWLSAKVTSPDSQVEMDADSQQVVMLLHLQYLPFFIPVYVYSHSFLCFVFPVPTFINSSSLPKIISHLHTYRLHTLARPNIPLQQDEKIDPQCHPMKITTHEIQGNHPLKLATLTLAFQSCKPAKFASPPLLLFQVTVRL